MSENEDVRWQIWLTQPNGETTHQWQDRLPSSALVNIKLDVKDEAGLKVYRCQGEGAFTELDLFPEGWLIEEKTKFYGLVRCLKSGTVLGIWDKPKKVCMITEASMTEDFPDCESPGSSLISVGPRTPQVMGLIDELFAEQTKVMVRMTEMQTKMNAGVVRFNRELDELLENL